MPSDNGVTELFEQDLGDGLLLRTVRSEDDAARYAAFSAGVGNAADRWTRDYLVHHHSRTTFDDYYLVEDTCTGDIVSTTCLLPWRCRLDGLELEVAQLEMVGTRDGYRRRGLIRAQIDHFHKVAAARGFDLCIIEGIPYYYRQFGYTYGVDHRGFDSLRPECIPDAADEGALRCRLRPATLEDVDLLTRLFAEAMAPLDFHVLRDADYWRLLLRWAKFPVRLVDQGPAGRSAGYICSIRDGDGQGTTILEASLPSNELALAALQRLKAETASEIRLAWPQESALVQLGRSLGSKPLPHYQWLLRLPDVCRFLVRLVPILERRLAASRFAGLTRDVCLNLYRQAFSLCFVRGQLRVQPVGFVDASMGADGGDIRVPPEAFVRLVLGYRSLEELRDAWPDAGAKPESRELVDALFPRLTSYFCAPYIAHGPPAQK